MDKGRDKGDRVKPPANCIHVGSFIKAGTVPLPFPGNFGPAKKRQFCRAKSKNLNFVLEEIQIAVDLQPETVVVAQLVRASDCGSEGRGFEPHHPPWRETCLPKS